MVFDSCRRKKEKLIGKMEEKREEADVRVGGYAHKSELMSKCEEFIVKSAVFLRKTALF